MTRSSVYQTDLSPFNKDFISGDVLVDKLFQIQVEWNSPEHVISRSVCVEQLFLFAMELHKETFSHYNEIFWGIFEVNIIHFISHKG